MSGQQIGTVIGGAIGAYFGGPAGAQLGMAIGGAIGGAVDPTHINGPKIGDGQQQSATDGAVIAWVQGTAMIAGTIVQVGPRRQIRHKDNGKGGPVTVTYTAVQDFAILVCESSELRDSTVQSVLMVIQDGKVVYDVRPGSTMLADSLKWQRNVDFMLGTEDQLPHPTLEAITGVGNTPAYRGSLVAVFKNFDVSQAGDRIPTFQFVVSNAPGVAAQSAWKLQQLSAEDPTDFSGDILDDRSWATGVAPFGSWEEGAPNPGVLSGPHEYDSRFSERFSYPWVVHTRLWLRGQISVSTVPPGGFRVISYIEDNCHFYVNGVLAFSTPVGPDGGSGATHNVAASYFRRGANTIAVRCDDEPDSVGFSVVYADFLMEPIGLPLNAPVPVSLASIVQRVAKRGGLDLSDVDVAGLGDLSCIGYPIARQANAADCLLPLLQANFGYASEYDAKLHFAQYGGDTDVVVARADLIEGNDANNGAIVSNLRNQSTEFPRRIVGSYMDPSQNFTVVNVAAERLATDVIAIGDQAFQIPVVMPADDAAKAVDKALKVAYATLEGTLEYSTPFAGADVYLSLVAGAPLQFQGKRYVLDELILGNGNLKLTTRYDRQSAYTSNVQAILGNAPTPPTSPYSGPTTLYPMNLPAQRPQDSVGVYIAAASTDGRDSWRGCNVQVSYDGMQTWQNALQINMESTIGTVALNEPVGGEPLTVDVVKYDLDSATPAQLAALANAFAVISSSDATQLGQFGTATETATDKQYELTNTSRSLGGTAAFLVTTGDRFTLMDAAYFLPVDPSFAGRTLYFRGVGFGEIAEDAEIFPLVYTALLQSTGQQRVAEDGTPRVAEDGFNLRFTEN